MSSSSDIVTIGTILQAVCKLHAAASDVS
jgi:hypothetical protein